MWIGNLDGTRQGLVIATSKARARKVVGTSLSDFNGYWVQQLKINETLEPEVLYTRAFDLRGVTTWQRGRCPLREGKPVP